ncbi:universal stress protein [Ktedonosporobacter rubrisoli]|nr:universal stress protein [Ktedonosporobacter rubrisoli]
MLDFNHDAFLERGTGYTAKTHLLLGVDAPLTTATLQALRTVGELFAAYSENVHILLLSVIPIPYVSGRYTPPSILPPTLEQRKQARVALQVASTILRQCGMARSRIETMVKAGAPGDELLRVARQQHIDCIVLGCQGYSLGQRLRRIFMGSMSHYVLRFASCPVLIVTQSQAHTSLVAWYERAIQQALHEHPGTLVNFTAREVASGFVPSQVQAAGRKECEAATRALERLASSGILSRRKISGETHYLND